MPKRTKVEIWTDGRHDCITCIRGTQYETGAIVVGAERTMLTENQMRKALSAKFPGVDFVITEEEGDMWVARSN